VDSIPTGANQEDYVSMGMAGARRLAPMLENLKNLLSMELLSACQGIDLLAPLRTGPQTQKALDLVRTVSATVEVDRSLSADIAKVSALVAAARFQEFLSQ
jgi:histidine ammonia-lyase